ncbi:MAG: 3-isopropylmalate dehydratase small subunit [bacterium]|nr:3-isopropylmalate dehydratase small subunit [bacterium]
MKIHGTVFVFGDNVNTDEIIPARYLSTSDPDELAKYCMEDAIPGFGQREDIKGAVLVAGDNFGCGSSREHAPIAIKAAGIRCVAARSFARIFLRNSINIGLPLVTLPKLESGAFKQTNRIEVDFEKGTVTNLTEAVDFSFNPYPRFMCDIIAAGGWLNYAADLPRETIL